MNIAFQNVLKRWKIPLFYLGLLVINYGIFIPWWGLYGDDWQYLYAYHLAGASGYPEFVAPDRPFSAWVYMVFTPFLGENSWAYHGLLLVLRWMAGLLLWKVLRNLFPSNSELAFWAGAVLVIYPGFRQQPLPLEFILHFTVLNLTLFSLFCMLKAVKPNPGRSKWTAAGIISALGIFSVEYFTGLELLRPILLWVKMRESHPQWRKRLKAVTLQWLPYLGVFIGFVFWRVFIFQFQHYKPASEGISNPVKFLVTAAWKALDSLWLALAKSWEVQLSLSEGLPAAFAQVALLLAGFLILYLVLQKMYPHNQSGTTEGEADSNWIIGVGAASLLLAGPLYWVLDIPIQQAFPWDRPLLSFIPGVAVLLAGTAVRLLVPKYRSLVLAGLCAVALLANFQNGRTYTAEWDASRAFLDQLTRRVPQVEPATMLLTQGLPFQYYGENTFFPILNWIYQPENRTAQMRLRIFDLAIRHGETTEALERGNEITQNYRSFRFASDKTRIVAFTYQPPGCLHVLSPDDADFPNLPAWLKDLVYLSKPELVQLDPQVPSRFPAVLGGPVRPNWCSVYADAERERQKQGWSEIRAIADLAEIQGLQPSVGYEYLPFIEAFARGGDWQRADHYFGQAVISDNASSAYLCRRWSIIASSIDQEDAGQLTKSYCVN